MSTPSGLPPLPPDLQPVYRTFRTIQEDTRHIYPVTVYDSAIGYGPLRVYHGFPTANNPDEGISKDPFYARRNYERDAVLEPQLVQQFIAYATGGAQRVRPDGEASEVKGPGLSAREVGEVWERGYAGSVRKCFDEAVEGEEGVVLHRAVKGLKVKIWEGMAPMSAERWHRRKLSETDNVYEAFEFLAKTVAVFEYFNDPKVQEVMRNLHNRVTDELQRFAGAVNDVRRKNGETEVPLFELWEEYIKALFKTTAVRAHGWFMARTAEMRKSQEEKFDMNKAMGALPDAENEKITTRLGRLVDIERDADFLFRISRYGFHRASKPAAAASSSSSHAPEADGASTEKFAAEQAKLREFSNRAIEIFATGATQMRRLIPLPASEQVETLWLMRDQLEANKGLRGKDPKKWNSIWGPAPQPQRPEPWVQSVRSRLERDGSAGKAKGEAEAEGGFGLVVYRWKEYEGVAWERLEAAITKDLIGWGEGMAGAEHIKAKTKLQWIEMAGGSVDNYRTHFKALRESGQLQSGIRHDLFLVIDPHAANAWFPQHLPADAPRAYRERHRKAGTTGTLTFSSTRSTALAAMPTDFEPWVLAVDPDFAGPQTSSVGGEAAAEVEFPGWVRVQSTLVFEDVFALAERGALRLEGCWKMAAAHPCGVYTGAVVTEVEKRRFVEWCELRNRAVRWVLDRPDMLFFARR